jgi:exodeoxyribonuclease V alpha subunit
VGPGNVLADIIACGKVSVVRLTEIFRQAEKSNIIVNAHRINRGEMPRVPERDEGELTDFYVIATEEPPLAQERIVQLVTDRIPNAFGMDPMTEVQVLAPMHRGDVGTQALNEILQEHFTAGNRELRRGSQTWRVGDKVMQTRNNYDHDIFNGDLGRIVEINKRTGHVGVKFDQRVVSLEYGELDDLTLAYAITVHKSQGAEYRGVVIPLLTQHYVMLQRNLLYTAVTRATDLVILVASQRAVSLAVRNDRSQRRYSRLDARI